MKPRPDEEYLWRICDLSQNLMDIVYLGEDVLVIVELELAVDVVHLILVQL